MATVNLFASVTAKSGNVHSVDLFGLDFRFALDAASKLVDDGNDIGATTKFWIYDEDTRFCLATNVVSDDLFSAGLLV